MNAEPADRVVELLAENRRLQDEYHQLVDAAGAERSRLPQPPWHRLEELDGIEDLFEIERRCNANMERLRAVWQEACRTVPVTLDGVIAMLEAFIEADATDRAQKELLVETALAGLRQIRDGRV